MTVYNDEALDWEALSVGATPTGFTARWNTSDFTIYSIDSGKSLGDYDIGNASERMFSHDSASADSNSDDAEILIKLQWSGLTSSWPILAWLRGSGATDSEDGYAVRYTGSAIRIYRYSNGGRTSIGSYTFSIAEDTWCWVRLRADGTAIKLGISLTVPPTTWAIEATNSDITGTGWMGPAAGSTTADIYWDYATFATDGDTALAPSAGGGPVTLTVQDATHSHLADGLSLVQAHILDVAEAFHAHAVDNVTLGVSGSLDVQDSAHAHSADNVELVQQFALAVAGGVHAHSADNVDLGYGLVLDVSDSAHAQMAESPSLVQANLLEVADAVHAHLGEEVGLITSTTMIVSDAAHAHLADNIGLTIPADVFIPISRTICVRRENRLTIVCSENRVLNIQ